MKAYDLITKKTMDLVMINFKDNTVVMSEGGCFHASTLDDVDLIIQETDNIFPREAPDFEGTHV